MVSLKNGLACNFGQMLPLFFTNHDEDRGGVATSVSPQLAHVIVGWETNPTQLVQTSSDLNGLLLVLANIYASNDAEESASF